MKRKIRVYNTKDESGKEFEIVEGVEEHRTLDGTWVRLVDPHDPKQGFMYCGKRLEVLEVGEVIWKSGD